jgi:hypothetical protein
MTELPKIVCDRMRNAPAEQRPPDVTISESAHLDADLLAAFAEQALSGAERDSVLGHLALCGDCREVAALALPAGETELPPIAGENKNDGWTTFPRDGAPAPRKLSFASSSLRWTALAAGVAVAGAMLLLHPGTLHQARLPYAGPRRVATALPPESGSRIASPDTSSPAAVVDRGADKGTANQQIAGKMGKKKVSARTEKQPIAPAAANSLMARNDTSLNLPLTGAPMDAPAIEKAKPASREEPNVTWTITAGGLQRSLDSGQSWQTSLRADGRLLCYAARGEDVWTGGQAGTLFHSPDGGATWIRVQPSIKDGGLTSDVTNINLTSIDATNMDVRNMAVRNIDVINMDRAGLGEIVISTSNNEIWSSTDGGKTWEKK